MKFDYSPSVRLLIAAACVSAWTMPISTLASAPALQDNIAGYASEAQAQGTGFAGFSAERGRYLFSSSLAMGKPDTPSCTSCHTADPTRGGQTWAGKAIEPMALSMTPGRYADPAKLEKWFRRNCTSVLGRVCTPVEKGDFLTFMSSQ